VVSLKKPSTDAKNTQKKTQVAFNAVTSVLSGKYHGNIKVMTSHTHLRGYISRSTSYKCHKLSIGIGRPMFQLPTLFNSLLFSVFCVFHVKMLKVMSACKL